MTPPSLDQYRAWLADADLTLNTITQRLRFAQSRLDAWGSFNVPGHVVSDYLNGFCGWTRYTYLNHLRSIYAWLQDSPDPTPSPIRRFKTPDQPRAHSTPLADDELSAVLTDAEGDLLAYLNLGYLSGLRAHEIAKFHGADITEQAIHVIGKNRHEAWLPTHPALWELAQHYPRDDFWFPSIQRDFNYVSVSTVGNKVRARFREAGITQGSVHRLRHTYATHLSRAGVPVAIIQQLLRHKSLQTTETYIGHNASEMAAAVLVLWQPGQPHPATAVPTWATAWAATAA